jgi:hypothetical protein
MLYMFVGRGEVHVGGKKEREREEKKRKREGERERERGWFTHILWCVLVYHHGGALRLHG